MKETEDIRMRLAKWALYLFPLLASAMIGCMENNNRVILENLAFTDIKFHFRGEVIELEAAGGTATIRGIKHGVYSYTTIVVIPDGLTGENIALGDELSGTVYFNGRNTKISIIFTSSTETVEASSNEEESTLKYTVNASVSSSEAGANPVSVDSRAPAHQRGEASRGADTALSCRRRDYVYGGENAA
ncbi:MAG: hypothetical protein GF344_15310 [Chitinivibrionales bacterium]|nr:hypothetical protein [Chitinivibrionales bacterium]MBD3358074.1 hypothetical protein [Chitinivibrionales bacterium]